MRTIVPLLILPKFVVVVSGLAVVVGANQFLLEDGETQLADPTDTAIASLQLSGNDVDRPLLQWLALEAVGFRSRIHEWGYGWS